MKVVINQCYGGFSLSPKAVQRLAELQGRPCYFFASGKYATPRSRVAAVKDKQDWISISLAEADEQFIWWAFDIPNPNEVFGAEGDWFSRTVAENEAQSRLHHQHTIDNRPDDRHNPLLVQVVEELGTAANGSHAKLKVVEIPDGTRYEIDEYDGMEHVAESHRTWS
jgi:hypothetical protein